MPIGSALIGLNRAESPRSTLESVFYVKLGFGSSVPLRLLLHRLINNG